MSDQTSISKGFSVTIGAVFALFVAFIVLPFGACVGLTVCGATAVKIGEQQNSAQDIAQAQASQTTVEELGQEVELSDLLFKVDTSNPYIHRISYKFTAKNNRNRNISKSFKAKFLDKDGLEVESDRLFGETINAGQSRTLSGTAIAQPGSGINIVSMEIETN